VPHKKYAALGETPALPGRLRQSYGGEYSAWMVQAILGKAVLKLDPWSAGVSPAKIRYTAKKPIF
jgi:hypothetical protein